MIIESTKPTQKVALAFHSNIFILRHIANFGNPRGSIRALDSKLIVFEYKSPFDRTRISGNCGHIIYVGCLKIGQCQQLP